jgi:1,4-alpha-glucan branching enzyme
MGAILYPGGTAFRVWAKFATQVYVIGDFNQWDESANPLAPEGNGYWSVDVLAAKEGDLYRYVIHSPFLAKPQYRTDPYAKRVDKNSGNGYITSAEFDWGPEGLETALWQIDGWSQAGGGGIYFYNDWRRHTNFGDRPDFGRPEVRQYIRDNVLMWLDEYHVDGLRFDSTINMRNVDGKNGDPTHDLADGWSLIQWLNDEIDRHQPWKISIAEDLQDNR